MKIRIVHTLRADWLYITLYGVRIKTSIDVELYIYIYIYIYIYTSIDSIYRVLYRISVLGTYLTSRYMLIT